MGYSVFPAPSSGGIKSVQRGLAAGSGTVTISSVNISKSFVTIYGTTSSGTVSASFNLNANTTSYTDNMMGGPGSSSFYIPPGMNSTITNITTPQNYYWTTTRNISAPSYSVGSGTNNLIAAVVQGYLSSSTTLEVSGACRWEVVEFN